MGSSFSLDPAVPMSEAVRRAACSEIEFSLRCARRSA